MGPSGPPVSAIRPSRMLGQRPSAVVCAVSTSAASRCARRDELHEVGVADLVHGQQRDVAVAGLAHGRHAARCRARCGGPRNRSCRVTPTIGWMPVVRQLVGELQRAVEVVGVGQPHRREAVRGGELGQLADGQRAFQQRIGRMHLEVHEARACRSRGAGGQASWSVQRGASDVRNDAATLHYVCHGNFPRPREGCAQSGKPRPCGRSHKCEYRAIPPLSAPRRGQPRRAGRPPGAARGPCGAPAPGCGWR